MKLTTMCLMGVLFGWSRTCLCIPILDQSNTYYNSGEFLGGATGISAIAQTFTPGVSGQLSYVNLLLDSNGSPGDPLVVSVYNTLNGLPNTVLGTEDLYNISGNYFAWYSVDFSSLDVQLTANELYAFVFTNPTGGYIYVRGTTDNTYAGGTELEQTTGSSSWQQDTRSEDISFQTYMSVPESPSFVTVILAAIFLISSRYLLRVFNA